MGQERINTSYHIRITSFTVVLNLHPFTRSLGWVDFKDRGNYLGDVELSLFEQQMGPLS